ncbi:hypothetical protein [Nostoc favosum]|nr:hypothetical protein [Nostoc favosum]
MRKGKANKELLFPSSLSSPSSPSSTSSSPLPTPHSPLPIP